MIASSNTPEKYNVIYALSDLPRKVQIEELKLMAALYATRPGVVDSVRRTGQLPAKIQMGGAHIGIGLLINSRGVNIQLQEDEQLVYDALVRDQRLPPGGCVMLIPEET